MYLRFVFPNMHNALNRLSKIIKKHFVRSYYVRKEAAFDADIKMSFTLLLQSLRGHSCAREVQRKFFHKWLETYLRCKKIEGDRLKSWCGPRNPRWPPRWRPIFLKMTVYIKLATTTCFYFVFGIKLIILEKNRYK